MKIKLKGLLIVLVLMNIFMGYKTIKKIEKEVVDKTEFTEYYTGSEADNGGYLLLNSNFTVYEKSYTIKTPAEKKEAKKEAAKRREPLEYTVKSGDTLARIAKKFDQTQSILKYNNSQIGKYLKIGEKLHISSGNSITYRVAKGDSLSRIASKFGRSVNEIKLDNHLTSSTVRLNQPLMINNPTVDLTRVTKTKLGFSPYWPVKWAGVTSPFGRRFHPVLKRWIGHLGVDLRAHYVDVRACDDGRVSFSGEMRGYGKIVILKHSHGYETRYGHLNKIYVKRGERVKRGQLIAQSGKTGRVTGPHLHFEIRKNGTPLNPMLFFK